MASIAKSALIGAAPVRARRVAQRSASSPPCTRASASTSAPDRDDDDARRSRFSRRGLVLGGASLAASLAAPLGPFAERAVAAEELTQEYRDAVDLYSFKVPAGWEKALGDTSPDPRSSRAVVAFYPPGDPDVNVNVVATALGADYQRMGSFGSADDFAFGVAAGMTRPKPKNGPKQFSYVLDAKNTGDKYALEYTVERPEEGFYQHLLSAVGVGYNGRISRLYTITAVCPEEKFAERKETFQAIIDTFELPPPMY